MFRNRDRAGHGFGCWFRGLGDRPEHAMGAADHSGESEDDGCRGDHHHGRHGGRGSGRPGMGRHGRRDEFESMGGPGRQRMFEHGDMRLVVLYLLSKTPQHGYELIKALQDLAGGDYSPSPGVIYPTLTLLEELGYAEVSHQAAGKKQLAITEEGRQWLAGQQEILERILARLASTAAIAQARQDPVMHRAMHNFRMALHLRLAREPLTEATLRQLAEIIDKAASDIERCE